jgi:hypothetical protein
MKEVKVYKEYFDSGELMEEIYHIDDFMHDNWHRTDGPAYTEYNIKGKTMYKSYWVNNKRHRVDGPAVINYYKKDGQIDGQIACEEYYLNDYWCTKEEFLASKEHQNYLADKAIDKMLKGE